MIKTAMAVFGLGLAAYGCSDATGFVDPIPAPEIRVGGPFLSLSTATETVRVLKRTVPLLEDVSTTSTIGPEGGTILLPTAGLKLIIPTGALSTPTPIKVTGLKGDLVAYTFEPHGTQFAKVVTAEQSLTSTESMVGRSPNSRGYFGSVDNINFTSSTAKVSEVSLVQPELTAAQIKFYLNHFSGYLVAID